MHLAAVYLIFTIHFPSMGITEELIAVPDSKIQELLDQPANIHAFLRETFEQQTLIFPNIFLRTTEITTMTMMKMS
jgi:hypothetical protein